jgi:hypothetical protein
LTLSVSDLDRPPLSQFIYDVQTHHTHAPSDGYGRFRCLRPPEVTPPLGGGRDLSKGCGLDCTWKQAEQSLPKDGPADGGAACRRRTYWSAVTSSPDAGQEL